MAWWALCFTFPNYVGHLLPTILNQKPRLSKRSPQQLHVLLLCFTELTFAKLSYIVSPHTLHKSKYSSTTETWSDEAQPLSFRLKNVGYTKRIAKQTTTTKTTDFFSPFEFGYTIQQHQQIKKFRKKD